MAEVGDAADEKALEMDLAELQVAIARKRNEVSNLTVGYRRAESGISPIPSEPLMRRLVQTRAQLTELEERLAALQRRQASA
ncbi:MAG TPA: hypothetical protein VFS62_00855 [Chloroflexota bacterium]|nr:hypothetical protein [Chloroflexota bacterium]